MSIMNRDREDTERLLSTAFRGWSRWASWASGYDAGKGFVGCDMSLALDELDTAEEDRIRLRPYSLVRWILAWVPAYRDLPAREAWEAFSARSRTLNRLRWEGNYVPRPCMHECAFSAMGCEG